MDKKIYDNFADLEKFGDKVQDIIENAVNSKDFQKMNQAIRQTVNKTVQQYQSAYVKKSQAVKNQPQQRQLPENLYARLNGQQVKNILLVIFGGILTGGMGLGLITVQLLQFLLESGSIVSTAMMSLGTAAGAGMLVSGCKGLGRVSRFKKYVKALGTRTYCEFDRLARITGKTVKYVKKDIRKMISKGWFLEGNMDRQETCLITSNETYRQYEETQKQLEMKREQEAMIASSRAKNSPQVQEVLDKGNEFIEKIRKSNDAIPGEEISAKIDKMEQIVRQIFRRAEEDPDIIPDLKRMMNYYLPMTIKLLDAYEEMDSQPVQGENIRSSKKEIEDTIDTLNEAFANLLDSVFQETAWDVSSDISVLHTVLAQEGLTGNDFTKKHQK